MIDFEDVADGQCVYMGNSPTVAIKGKRNVLLKFTSRQMLSLSNVLFVPSLRRNLVSSTLLDIVGPKLHMKLAKLLSYKIGILLGRGIVVEDYLF